MSNGDVFGFQQAFVFFYFDATTACYTISVDTNYEVTNPAYATNTPFTIDSLGVNIIDDTVSFSVNNPTITAIDETATLNLVFPFPSPGVTISDVCMVDIQPTIAYQDKTFRNAGTYTYSVTYGEDHPLCDVLSDMVFTVQQTDTSPLPGFIAVAEDPANWKLDFTFTPISDIDNGEYIIEIQATNLLTWAIDTHTFTVFHELFSLTYCIQGGFESGLSVLVGDSLYLQM